MPTILAVNNDASEIARRLLAAAGDRPDRVKTVTGGKYPGFEVDDELAVAAGFVASTDPDSDEEPDESTKLPDPPAPDAPRAATVEPTPQTTEGRSEPDTETEVSTETEQETEPVAAEPVDAAPAAAPEPAPATAPAAKASAKRASRKTETSAQ